VKKGNCYIGITRDDKMVPTRVQEQDMKKPKVVIDYNSGKEGANNSDAYLTSYCSKRKELK
jgi:hypothetical protein